MLKSFWADQNGAVVSIEMVLIITIAVLSLIVGWSEVAVSVNQELNDISNAVGALNQSYRFSGFGAFAGHKLKSFFAGSCFEDHIDDCDQNECEIVCAVPVRGEAHGHP
jgi:Flp pilus assembly pilin Flp